MNTPVHLVLAALGGVLALAAFGLLAFIAGAVTGTPAAAAPAPASPVVVVPAPSAAPTSPLPAPRTESAPVVTPAPVPVLPAPTVAPESAPAQPPAEPAPAAPARGNAADAKASGIYSDGTYLVGADIAPGDYWTNGPDVRDMAFWSRLSDTSGSMDSIIANGIVQGPTTITIAPGDHAVQFSGHAAWTKR